MAQHTICPRVSTGKLNTVNDAVIGGPVATPTGNAPWPGLLGQVFELSEAAAQRLDSALHAGKYQYVKFKAGSTASNARGQIVVWDDQNDFVVTPDVTAASIGNKAGITLNAVSKGNYGWIQLIAGGVGTVLFGTITKVSPVAGDLVIVANASSIGKGEVLADATGLTSPTAKCILGVAQEAPASDGLKLVQLTGSFEN